MKRTTLVIVALVAIGCQRTERAGSEVTEVNAAQPAAADNTEKAAADNTEKNERDRNPSALTPGDQGENKADREITQSVRQKVVGHDGLSMTAENVKIITVDGVVTLRGPVKDAQERATIGDIAQRIQGVKRVDNQLEIASR